MNRIAEAYLLTETITKDSHGQSIPTVMFIRESSIRLNKTAFV